MLSIFSARQALFPAVRSMCTAKGPSKDALVGIAYHHGVFQRRGRNTSVEVYYPTLRAILNNHGYYADIDKPRNFIRGWINESEDFEVPTEKKEVVMSAARVNELAATWRNFVEKPQMVTFKISKDMVDAGQISIRIDLLKQAISESVAQKKEENESLQKERQQFIASLGKVPSGLEKHDAEDEADSILNALRCQSNIDLTKDERLAIGKEVQRFYLEVGKVPFTTEELVAQRTADKIISLLSRFREKSLAT
jgi:hypothetical protein